MARLLAEQRESWVILDTKPDDPMAVETTDLSAGVRAECFLTTNTRLSPTGSQTANEASLCDTASAQTPVTRQWDGTIEVFRDLDPDTGLPVSGGEAVYDALNAFGEKVWLWRRRGPLYTQALADGDPYDLFEVVLDAVQDPSDRSGSFKAVIPVFVHNQWTSVVGGASSPA